MFYTLPAAGLFETSFVLSGATRALSVARLAEILSLCSYRFMLDLFVPWIVRSNRSVYARDLGTGFVFGNWRGACLSL